MAAKQKSSSKRALLIRSLLSALLLAAAAYVLARNWPTVSHSVQLARGANLGWLAAALALMAATFCIAAAMYGALALHALRFRQTLLIEVATAFVNKLLPAGIGGLGLHGVYLYKRGHTTAEATVVVSMNNLLGMVAHFVILGAVVLGYPQVLGKLLSRSHGALNWHVGVAIVTLAALLLAVPPVRRRVAIFARHLLASIRKLRPAHLLRALVLAMLLTTTYTLILFATAHSIGAQLGPAQVFIVFSIGMLTATATPTPGGLVGAEAGLFAGFVAYGVSSPTAGAAVLLYRLVTYWLPLVPGAAALLLARRTKLV